MVDSASAFLSNSGIASLSFYTTADNSYFIAIKHRNSMETWSSDSVALSNSAVNIYGFTSAADKAYGNNMKELMHPPFVLRYTAVI
ncbi:MAG: hypothetical protein ABI462_07695 [Ignavibacteria bacterium]